MDPFSSENLEGWAKWSGSGPEDSEYRYALGREFLLGDDKEGRCLFIMLNPSTATGEEFDPTVRRCAGYAWDWGYRYLHVANIFALRATNPDELYEHDHPQTHPEEPLRNDEAIANLASISDEVVCAWGNHGQCGDEGQKVVDSLQEMETVEPKALTMTKAGEPGHPLYLSKDLEPKPISSFS